MTTPDLSATLAGIPLTSVLYNASGPRTGSSTAMAKIAASAAGAVLAKSATVAPQKGNDMPRTWHEDNGTGLKDSLASLNSEGLPNAGNDYYISSQTIQETMGENPSNKAYMVSISGKNLAENLKMLEQISDVIQQQRDRSEKNQIAAVELNLACPNIVGKPTIGYDFEQMEDVLEKVCSLPCFASSPPLFPLGVKLPPYFDRPHFEMAAALLNRHKRVLGYAASINTVGNALAVDYRAEMPAVRANGGYAGLSGPAVKYTALANVRQLRELLDPAIAVVGVGGVTTGRDAFEMLLCGATAVQVGTCHWIEGPGCFARIGEELRGIMREKGYMRVDDFRGRLKEWSKEGAAASRKAKMAEKLANGGGGNAAANEGGGKAGTQQSALIAVLFAIIAVLLADKFQIVSF